MSKQSGLGDGLYVAGLDLSGDIGSLSSIASPAGAEVVTGIDKGAQERLRGLRDGSLDFQAWFNPATSRAHPVLSALPRADRIVTYARGTEVGAPGACMVGKQIDYAVDRAQSGALSLSISAQANRFGLEWGDQLTAGYDDTLTSAGAFDSLDYGAGVGTTLFGLQAYAQVHVVGSSATLAVQHSDDNGSGDAWANVTGGAFPIVNIGNLPPVAMRIQTARDATVKRWLRVNVTGTFTELFASVVVVRNHKAVALT